ncbi:MAG: helix-turn-helix transcriptional regulator [Fibromonadales bacterium]|nr:helix-turn-helix transcriptional regulator [Fibromonadales bacterium]
MSENQCFLGVKKFRERLGWNQIKMAKELGCKNSSIYHHWENGKYTPPFAVIKQLFEMGATVEELFGVPYKGANEPLNLAGLSDADMAEIVKRGMGYMAGNGVG